VNAPHPAPDEDARVVEGGEHRWDTARVEAFSDGVFAIAITLLVLEIQVEPSDFDDLLHSLLDKWPAFLAYVTSFCTVGGVWLAHHRLFVRLRFVDPSMMRINLLLLLFAAFLPFPTGLLAEAFDHSREAERAAVAFYGATAAAIELCMTFAWRYAVTHHELMHEPTDGPQHRMEQRGIVNAAMYAALIVFAVLVVPRMAAIAYLVVAMRAVLQPAGEGRLTLQLPRRRASSPPPR
jgi:TMEM175 potassium channel family protein